MQFHKIFPNVAMDYFGYVGPAATMREVCECISIDTDHDGVGFRRMITELGATWMMGQVVLEAFHPIRSAMEVVIETLPYEKMGVAVMRRAEIRHEGELMFRQTNKTLPVSFAPDTAKCEHCHLVPVAPGAEGIQAPGQLQCGDVCAPGRRSCRYLQ